MVSNLNALLNALGFTVVVVSIESISWRVLCLSVIPDLSSLFTYAVFKAEMYHKKESDY